MPPLNSDLLRTFLAIVDAGSVTGGAARIGRSQSATSLQIRQLEQIVQRPLFKRHGRGVILTPAGEHLRPEAQRIVRALDRTLADLRGEGLAGRVRIGMPEEHSQQVLAGVISDFAALHPRVELEVSCALGTGFPAALAAGSIDLAVFEVSAPTPGQIVLAEDMLSWRGHKDIAFEDCEVLPVALFDQACWWRDVALADLDTAKRAYRIAFSSESAGGVRAAIVAGIAVGLQSARTCPSTLRSVAGLGAEHPTFLVLEQGRSGAGPACDALVAAVENAYRDQLGSRLA